MPRASKQPVNKNIFEQLQENFSFLISSLSSSKDIQHFFDTFLTREEKIMLTKRLMLHLMLDNVYEPADIAMVLGLSRETVYKHHFIWQKGDNTYKAIINKIAKRKKTQEFWKKVEKILYPLELAFRARNDMKARAKIMYGDFSKEEK